MNRLYRLFPIPTSTTTTSIISNTSAFRFKSSIKLGNTLSRKMTLTTLANLEKTSSFTDTLPPDSQFPSIEASKTADDEKLRMRRRVHGGIFTWLAPEKRDKYTFLAASPDAVRELGLEPSEIETELFQKIMSGEQYFEDPYPWAQAYAGYQFGQWAGQLGDGRALSLFEGTNPDTGKRFEVQLKGSGLTPYSRFADGKAVLRSSIREFLASEAVNALGIPTTRALAITLLPKTVARRETIEPCAVVARMAETWIRLGTFSFAKQTGGVEMTQKLVDYAIDHVFGGEDNLIPGKEVEGDDETARAVQSNKYVRFYREVVKRNAEMLAKCQVYGFMNGVLNTDNTSLYGLSMDYGPFAFMDTFDPSYSPNHDDGQLRYGYKYVPTSMWWNLVRLAEDLGELLGSSGIIGHPADRPGRFTTQEEVDVAQKIVTDLVQEVGAEYQSIFKTTWDQGFQKRLGLTEFHGDQDHNDIFQGLLDVLEECAVDFNQFFRTLGSFRLFDKGGANANSVDMSETSSLRNAAATAFLPKELGPAATGFVKPDVSKRLLADWLVKYRARLEAEGSTDDDARKLRMDAVNPKFVLKNWVVDEVIKRVQQDFDLEILKQVLEMSVNPFEDTWGFDPVDEMRFTGEVPSNLRDQMCSCSS